MNGPFNPVPPTGTPPWSTIPSNSTNFMPIDLPGLTTIMIGELGFGEGGFGEGGFDTPSQTIKVDTIPNWQPEVVR